MELNWVDDMLALLDDRNFSMAATRRFVSQPAFSRRIQSLEAWLGVELVDRTTKPVSFRLPVDHLRQEFQGLRDRIFDLRSELRAASQAHKIVRVAAQQSLTVVAFPAMSRKVKDIVSSASFRIRSANREECVAMFLRHEVDILLCYETEQLAAKIPASFANKVDLGTEKLIPAGIYDRFAGNQSLPIPVPLLLYPATSFLGAVVKDSCLQRPLFEYDLEMICESAFAAGLKEMVLKNLGVAWLPRRLIQAELDSNKLVDLSDTLGSVALQESMYWNRGAQSQLSQEVIEAIETALVV